MFFRILKILPTNQSGHTQSCINSNNVKRFKYLQMCLSCRTHIPGNWFLQFNLICTNLYTIPYHHLGRLILPCSASNRHRCAVVPEFRIPSDPLLNFIPLEKACLVVVLDPLLVDGSTRNHRENFWLSRRRSGPSGELLTPILEGFLGVHRDKPDDELPIPVQRWELFRISSKLLASEAFDRA